MSDSVFALFHAATSDDVDSLVALFDDTPDPNFCFSQLPPGTSCFGTKPIPLLNVACSHGSLRCAEYLVESGAGIEQADGSGHRAIHAAAFSGDTDVLCFLYSNGSDLSATSGNDSQPIHIAAAACRIDAVEWLLDNGADIESRNHFNRTPFLIAVAGESIDLAEFLVARGSDVTARDDIGNYALHIALLRHRFEIARNLMSLDLISWNAMNFDGLTFPIIACQLKDLGLLQYLISMGSNCLQRDRKKRTVLHHAIQSRGIDIVRFLLDPKVVDPTLEDEVGLLLRKSRFYLIMFVLKCLYSALHFAAISGSLMIVRDVIAFDRQHLNSRSCGFTPLHLACKHNSLEIVEFLCSIPGVNLGPENRYHQNLIHVAARNGSTRLVAFLLEQDEFDLSVPDTFGVSASWIGLRCTMQSERDQRRWSGCCSTKGPIQMRRLFDYYSK
jgi:ankyrin repeat protein